MGEGGDVDGGEERAEVCEAGEEVEEGEEEERGEAREEGDEAGEEGAGERGEAGEAEEAEGGAQSPTDAAAAMWAAAAELNTGAARGGECDAKKDLATADAGVVSSPDASMALPPPLASSPRCSVLPPVPCAACLLLPSPPSPPSPPPPSPCCLPLPASCAACLSLPL